MLGCGDAEMLLEAMRAEAILADVRICRGVGRSGLGSGVWAVYIPGGAGSRGGADHTCGVDLGTDLGH
jgi:hypothetical protein